MSIHRTSLTRRRVTTTARTIGGRRTPTIRRPLAPRHARPGPAVGTRLAEERGDVPGWVLITIMTAGIVVALWAVASDQIVAIFQNAMAPFLDGTIG